MICPTPNKRAYLNSLDAQIALVTVQWKRKGGKEEVRSYRCPCGWWHLTSKPRGGQRQRVQ